MWGIMRQEGANAKDAAMSTWLQQNDLFEYREDFSKAGIGQDMLALLGDEELRQMGIVTLGPRRRILAAILATQVMLLSCRQVPAMRVNLRLQYYRMFYTPQRTREVSVPWDVSCLDQTNRPACLPSLVYAIS